MMIDGTDKVTEICFLTGRTVSFRQNFSSEITVYSYPKQTNAHLETDE